MGANDRLHVDRKCRLRAKAGEQESRRSASHGAAAARGGGGEGGALHLTLSDGHLDDRELMMIMGTPKKAFFWLKEFKYRVYFP